MDLQTALQQYKDIKKELANLRYAIFIMNYDETTDCPKKDRIRSAEVQEYFEQKYLDRILDPSYIELIETLYGYRANLDEVTRLDVEIEYKELEKTRKIPRDELDLHQKNMMRAGRAWEEARDTLDYAPFIRELKEFVVYLKKSMVWLETDTIKGFDVLLNEQEEGYTEALYDEFFDLVERELVPFVKDILKRPKPYNTKLDTLKFPISKQKELTEQIAELMGYTDEVGCIRETAHPFTNWANHNDVRITTSYDESLLFSNLYSVMHEIGHALFQLQMDPKYDDTNIFGNVSDITHESQSRFYENYLGRSHAFISYLYPELMRMFREELEGITEEDLYGYVNAAQAQFKRTEADELTYPLHILIRYKVEKMLFHDEITVDDIPLTFNRLMKSYLGIEPRNLKEGCYQDVHWSFAFGYFPTYAVGSAYGAMFYEALKKDVPVDKELQAGSFKNVNAWLKEHIHKYSGTRKNLEVVRAVCHTEFDPKVYIRYLKEKYTELYR